MGKSYMQDYRNKHNLVQFNTTVEKEKYDELTKKLSSIGKQKKEWLNEKIEEELKK